MDPRRPQVTESPPSAVAGARFIGVAFGLFFASIGLTVAISSIAVSGFHAPPLLFRVVGILFGLLFTCVGGALAVGALRRKSVGRLPPRDVHRFGPAAPASAGQVGYACPYCAAPLGEGADVSPHGDVKCTHCGRWFNIHGRTASAHL